MDFCCGGGGRENDNQTTNNNAPVSKSNRSVIPIMQSKNLINDMYRAANVLQVGSYWYSMFRAVSLLVFKHIVVLHNHNGPASMLDRLVAKEILMLTLGGGLDKEMISQHVVDDIECTLSLFPGDWTSDSIVVRCTDLDCAGGPACRAAWCHKVVVLLMRVLFGHKVRIPSLNRWWTCAPVAAQMLLGIALHSIWARAAPAATNQAANAGAIGDVLPAMEAAPGAQNLETDLVDWHKLHSFRVRKTFQFFNRPDTCVNLILLLQSLRPAQLVMAWIQKHTARNQEEAKEDNVSVISQFVDVKTAPVIRALGLGSKQLRDRSMWYSLWAYNRAPLAVLLLNVWQSTLPAQAILYVRGVQQMTDLPLAAVELLSDNPDVFDPAASRFVSLKLCCVNQSFQEFKAAVTTKADCKSAVFQGVAKEIVSHISLATYDMEIGHARFQRVLRSGGGHTCSAVFEIPTLLLKIRFHLF